MILKKIKKIKMKKIIKKYKKKIHQIKEKKINFLLILRKKKHPMKSLQ